MSANRIVMVRPDTIADTPDKLTPEWLSLALSSSGLLDGVSVAEAQTQPLGTGQMCDSVRISVTYDGPTDAPTSLVAKLPAADPTSRNTAMMLRNYVKEVNFYRQLVGTLKIRTPRVYYADIDESGVSFVLLMQDMAPAQQGDQLAGCTPETALVFPSFSAANWEFESANNVRTTRCPVSPPTHRYRSCAVATPRRRRLWQSSVDHHRRCMPARPRQLGR